MRASLPSEQLNFIPAPAPLVLEIEEEEKRPAEPEPQPINPVLIAPLSFDLIGEEEEKKEDEH